MTPRSLHTGSMIVALLALCGSASAAITVSSNFLTVTASSTVGSETLTSVFNVPVGSTTVISDPDEEGWEWNSGLSPIALSATNSLSQNVQIGSLEGLSVRIARGNVYTPGPTPDDPWEFAGQLYYVDFDFNFRSGNADTTFQINFPTMSFDSLAGATALSSFSFNARDQGNGFVSIAPALGLGNAFYFQGMSDGNIAHDYTDILTTATGDNGIVILKDGLSHPAGQFTGISGISSLSANFGFTLSANDVIGGVGGFNVLPAPGASALLAAGLLLASRRRR